MAAATGLLFASVAIILIEKVHVEPRTAAILAQTRALVLALPCSPASSTSSQGSRTHLSSLYGVSVALSIANACGLMEGRVE